MRYNQQIIKSFKHKGLEKFFKTGNQAGIQSDHAKKLKMRLAAIHSASEIEDIDLPGYRLHPLKGNREGIWSISVNGNWRLTFEFIEGKACILNYEDNH